MSLAEDSKIKNLQWKIDTIQTLFDLAIGSGHKDGKLMDVDVTVCCDQVLGNIRE